MIDRIYNTVPKIINDLKNQDSEFKDTQKIAGDSWVPYRYTGATTLGVLQLRFLVFTQDDTSRPATVRLQTTPDLTLFTVGVRPQNGVHYFIMYNYDDFSTVTKNYTIYSTMTGTVTVASIAPF